MKKYLLLSFLLVASQFGLSQIKAPQLSPKAQISQLVGLTDVNISYSRPSARGRYVFNNLVPFGKLWRTGANENTIISFSEDITIDNKVLKKGKYALFSIPKADSWEIIFYNDISNWGLPENFDEAKVALRTVVKSEMQNKNVETFTINIVNIDPNFACIEFSWEKTIVNLKFEVPTQKATLASIENVLRGPTASDYFTAAQYFYQSNADINKSKTYIDKAIELSTEKPFWFTRLKSLIQAKLGDLKGAIATAKISLEAATTAKNQDYVKMNKDSIEEWSKK